MIRSIRQPSRPKRRLVSAMTIPSSPRVNSLKYSTSRKQAWANIMVTIMKATPVVRSATRPTAMASPRPAIAPQMKPLAGSIAK